MNVKSNNNNNTADSNNDKSHNDSIISQFTKSAVSYAHLSEHSDRYGIELMLKLSKPQSNDLVLDVACGTGIVSCEFAKCVSHVTGIDLTPAMIEQAKKLQQQKQLKNITWKIDDVSKPPLPFDDSAFSIVVTRYSLHHLLEPKKVLQEMMRVCTNKGGKILVIDVTPDSDKVDAYNHVEKLRDPSHAGALTLTELENHMREIGLINLRVAHHDLEMELETILQTSCPNQDDDANKIRLLFKEDLTKNNLGMRSHLKESKIHFYFPISMVVGEKK